MKPPFSIKRIPAWLGVLLAVALVGLLALVLTLARRGESVSPPASTAEPPAILVGGEAGAEIAGEGSNTPPTALKAPIAGPGVYAIDLADLADRLPAAEPTGWQVTLAGEALPAWIEEERLLFYVPDAALPLEYHRYTTGWFVIIGPGTQDLGTQAPREGGVSLRIEENHLYEPMALFGAEEAFIPWFWERMIAPAELTLPFDVLAGAEDAAALEVHLWSKTTTTVTLQAALNDVPLSLSTGERDSSASRTPAVGSMTFDLPGGALQAGENILRLELLADPAGLVSILYLDALVLTPTQGSLTEIPAAALTPLLTTPDLRQADIQGDYLAIGPASLLTALQPLLDARRAQGLTPLAVPVELIYDQFGGGSVTPFAVQAYLRYAAENWAEPPRFLLLVGDWTYDPLNYLPESAAHNLLPSFFTLTTFGGETVTDLPYTLLDGDGLPDLAAGRLPASTPEQVADYIAKVLHYEQNPADWQANILALADNFDPSFQDDAALFLDSFPEEYVPTLVAPPAAPAGEQGPATGPSATAEEITRRLEEEGALVFAYFGHGSLRQLGKASLFTSEDGAALSNFDRLPVVLNITCLAGLFTHPKLDSLAEVLLWNPAGGAIAALSATSLTTPMEQTILTQAFAAALVQAHGGSVTLGDVVLQAQRAALTGAGAQEVVETFLLFGDPGLIIGGRDMTSPEH